MRRQQLLSTFMVLLVIIFMVGCQDVSTETSAFSYNSEGMKYMESGEPEKALIEFEKAVELGLEKSAGYNNIGWAYNEMGEFEKGLKYIEMAQELDSDDSTQYTNHGNSLYGLGRYEKALSKYEKAKELDNSNQFAYYGLASVYDELAEYEKAVENYLLYLELVPGDFSAKMELTYCYFNQNDLLKSYTYIEKVIEEHPEEFEAYDMKGYIMEFLESREKIEEYYKSLTERFPDKKQAWLNLGIYYYDINAFNEAKVMFEKADSKYPDDADIYGWLAACFSKMEKEDEALKYAKAAIDIDPSPDNYSNIGRILVDQTKYLEAIKYYKKAQDKSTYLDEFISIKILSSYLYAKRYQKCIDFGLSVVDEIDYSYDIPWIMAYAFKEKYNYNNAIKYLNMTKERGADPAEIDYDLAENYYYLGDYEETEKYINLCLEKNLDHKDALNLKKDLELKKSGSENIVRTIIKDYYLYSNIMKNGKKQILEPKDLSYEEKSQLFYSLVKTDDIYSYYLYGDLYELFKGNKASSIEFENEDEDIILVNIHSFNEDTYNLFIEYMDKVNHPENKTLIINLMNNGGGLTESAIDILDSLLPRVVICSLIDRKGNVYPYYSNACMINFKQIYVFIDRNTASASELLALGLDTYLENVTIVGEQSHGKGVGQIIFEEPNKKSAYFIVNHYWNVRETNIMGVGIKPELQVKNPSVESSLRAIKLR